MSVPIVPLSAFSNLAGAAMADDLRRLLASSDYAGLVLFSDTLGEQLALLPVGAGQAYARIEDVGGAEIEGLRPLCALRLRGAAQETKEGEREREKELDRLEAALKARERHIVECEQKIAEANQGLAEREAMLEQREEMLMQKEREFFRRSGETARQVANAGS
jgi:hypothetical protein